jgi:small subunit ribosomal protein S1
MSEKDQYKEKFRPESDTALDREVEAALAGVSLETVYTTDREQPGGPPQAPDAGGKGPRRGKVVSVTPDDVFVDLGGKSPGVCPTLQFEAEPKVGEEYDFFVERYETREGILLLTRKGAVNTAVNWENLEIGQLVEGEVTGMNKGGLELAIKGMRAFMPAGQVDIVFHKDISTFIGQRIQAEVTQFDRDKKNLIVSRRHIMEREKEAARVKLMEELAEGQVRRGTVRTVMDYGAFVDLGGVDGLLHVSELSHRRVKNPHEVIKEGDMVDVKIIRIDKETGKLSLSLKQTMSDPWNEAASRYAVGTPITARVARIESFGCFLEVEDGIEGLLPVSEMSWQRIRHPQDVVKEGDTIKVVVLSLDPVQRKMSFSLKQAGGDPWAQVESKFVAGTSTTGRITRTAEFGAFVELEPGLEGLVHISELSNQRVRTPGDVVKPGQEVKVRILEIDKDKRRISLSLRRAEEVAVPVAPPTPVDLKKKEAKEKKRAQLRGGLDR